MPGLHGAREVARPRARGRDRARSRSRSSTSVIETAAAPQPPRRSRRRDLRDALQGPASRADAAGTAPAPRRRAAASGRACPDSRARRDRTRAAAAASPRGRPRRRAAASSTPCRRPTPCSPVIEPPASTHATRIASASCARPLGLARRRARRRGRAGEGCRRRRGRRCRRAGRARASSSRDPAQHLGQLRARHDAVLDVVALARSRPIAANADLRPFQSSARSASSAAARISDAPRVAADRARRAARSSSTCTATPSSSTISTAPAPSG